MTRRRTLHAELIAATALLISFLKPHVTYAQPSGQPTAQQIAAADALYDEAMDLLDAGKLGEAIPKLEASLALDPTAVGATYQLGDCYENTGRVASAWGKFKEAEAASKALGAAGAARVKKAKERRVAIEMRVPWMTVNVPSEVGTLRGFSLRRNGTEIVQKLWRMKEPIDPGTYVLKATAHGKKEWERTYNVIEGASIVVEVPSMADDPTLEPTTKLSSVPGGSLGIAAIVTGVVGLGFSAGFGLHAMSQWNDAKGRCQQGRFDACDDTAISLQGSASTSATISTIGGVLGGAGVVTFIVSALVLKPQAHPVTRAILVPVVDRDKFVWTLHGTF